MKKLLLIACIVFAGYSANAQFRAAVSGGIPVGDFDEFYSFNLNVDLAYLFDVSDAFEAGPTIGYSSGFLKIEFDGDGLAFLPIAAAGRFYASERLSLGADLGYAVGIQPDGNDGGFYYAPRVGYSISDLIEIFGSFRGVSLEGATWNALVLGIELGLD